MTRIMLRILAALVAVGVLVAPALIALAPDDATTGPDPVRITDYTADYVVLDDGTLVAKEQVTATFPFGRHGIFRFWDLEDPSDPRVRLEPRDVRVQMDGRDVPFDLQWKQGRRFRVAKIGDPDSYVTTGSHVYSITYRIKGALSPSTAGQGDLSSSSWTGVDRKSSVLYWNVVAPGWQMDIARSTVTMSLPAPSGTVQCTTGFDDGEACDVSGEGTDQITVRTEHLSPRTPVTVRVALPIAAPERVTAPWSVAADPVLGHSAPRLWIVVAISLFALAIGHLLERRSREKRPGHPVTYEPPRGLGPVQTAYMTTETVPRRGLVATLLYQAEQGLTTLTDNGGRSWTITGAGDAQAWAGTDDVTRYVGGALGVTEPGATFTARPGAVDSGQLLQTVQNALTAQTRAWASGIGAQRSAASEILARVAVAVAAVAFLVIGIFWHPMPSMYLLPLAAFAIGGAGLMTAGVGRRRTALGRELWSRAGGFKRLLSTDSAQDRFDFSGRTDLYTAFIPYAVAFDCADRWARKYEIATGSPAPVPLWYGGASGAAGSAFAGGGEPFSGFESSLTSAISAYSATQSSSSSGGGGFSGGGGGGGGGGGSW